MADKEHREEVLLFPQVVKTVFQFLPAKSICQAASVCKLWRSQADIVLRQRRQYCWELFDNDGRYSSDEQDERCMWTKIQDYFKDLSFRPSTVLVFMTEDMGAVCGYRRGKRTAKKAKKGTRDKDDMRNVHGYLPPECRVMCCVANGIIGTSSNLSKTVEHEEGEGVAVLCFGRQPGIEVVPCKCHDESRGRSFDDLFQDFNNPEQPELLDTKAVLLLGDSYNGFIRPSRNGELRNPSLHPLIVGGITNSTFIRGPWLEDSAKFLRCAQAASESESVSWTSTQTMSHVLKPCPFAENRGFDSKFLGRVILTGENVRVACVKISEYIITVEEVEKKVVKLKEMSADFPMQHSVAFMFACVARGEDHYGKSGVESAAFRKHFPTTPLLGFFGNGEIGCDYPVQPGQSGQMIHGYTTFLALICFP